ncbi:hypothetical protein Rsub_12865 [Raphidocelis subcapitata]|uniref:Uncharacterized protein n=1 Tax=Raphidocelis subcapitata TaxID=307507 RepID=A0A2V0PKG3_9CHLO|nr:hypothetical protein Rsub_12865 [Raphidocelis subcapitata]|eukprot:GBG00040.1 hypothetical protein Rsub_12865 [Raphidocelis subcapitata]
MDALTPRSRQAALEASLGDQEAPRSARDDEAAAQRKETLLAATRASPSPRASAFGAAGDGARGRINLKQLAARAATPTGSGPSTPRGGVRDKEAAAAAQHAPRGGDQTPRSRAAAGRSPRGPAAPAPAPAELGSPGEAEQPAEAAPSPAQAPAPAPEPDAGAAPPSAAPQAPAPSSGPAATPARAAPVLHMDAPSEGGAAEAQPPSADGEHPGQMRIPSLGLWPARSSAGGAGLAPALSLGSALGTRRTTGPGGLTAAELLLMDSHRPSRADDEGEAHHWGAPHAHTSHGGAGHGAGPSVDPIKEEVPAAGPGDDGAHELGVSHTAVSAGVDTARAAARTTIAARARRVAQPVIIGVLAAALVVTMVFVFTPGLLAGGAGATALSTVAAAAPAAATGASAGAGVAAQAAMRIIGPLAAAGFAVAPLVADVIGFVAAQNPAWLQPGLDPAKISWAPPTAEHCASMAALPAVQFLCTGSVAGAKLG